MDTSPIKQTMGQPIENYNDYSSSSDNESKSEACSPDKNSYENQYESNNEYSPSSARIVQGVQVNTWKTHQAKNLIWFK
jgi:hypothetical protein